MAIIKYRIRENTNIGFSANLTIHIFRHGYYKHTGSEKNPTEDYFKTLHFASYRHGFSNIQVPRERKKNILQTLSFTFYKHYFTSIQVPK